MIGTCHCGRVVFKVAEPPRTAVRCNCSYCVRRGWYTGYAELDQFELLEGTEHLRSYRFGAGTAQNFFCEHCGIHTHFYSTYTDPPHYGYNIACCEEVAIEGLELKHIDGKSF